MNTRSFDGNERLAVVEKTIDLLAKIVDDHENRLRKLERIIMYGAGFVGFAAVLWNALKH